MKIDFQFNLRTRCSANRNLIRTIGLGFLFTLKALVEIFQVHKPFRRHFCPRTIRGFSVTKTAAPRWNRRRRRLTCKTMLFNFHSRYIFIFTKHMIAHFFRHGKRREDIFKYWTAARRGKAQHGYPHVRQNSGYPCRRSTTAKSYFCPENPEKISGWMRAHENIIKKYKKSRDFLTGIYWQNRLDMV